MTNLITIGNREMNSNNITCVTIELLPGFKACWYGETTLNTEGELMVYLYDPKDKKRASRIVVDVSEVTSCKIIKVQ